MHSVTKRPFFKQKQSLKSFDEDGRCFRRLKATHRINKNFKLSNGCALEGVYLCFFEAPNQSRFIEKYSKTLGRLWF
jgi:hypothetical protein